MLNQVPPPPPISYFEDEANVRRHRIVLPSGFHYVAAVFIDLPTWGAYIIYYVVKLEIEFG